MTPARRVLWWVLTVAIVALAGCSAEHPWSRGAPDAEEQRKLTAQVSMARLSERHGQVRLAEKVYQQVLRKDPKNQQAAHRLAVVAAKEGRYDEARRRFENALSLGSPSSVLLSDYGYCLYLQDDLGLAERVLRDALQRDPQEAAAHNNLALVLGEQERFDESLAEFRKVVGEAEALANLGFVQSQLGYYEQAEANWHRALTLAPDLRPAAEALLQLAQVRGKMPSPVRASPNRVVNATSRDASNYATTKRPVRLSNYETTSETTGYGSRDGTELQRRRRLANIPTIDQPPRVHRVAGSSPSSVSPPRSTDRQQQALQQQALQQQAPWRERIASLPAVRPKTLTEPEYSQAVSEPVTDDASESRNAGPNSLESDFRSSHQPNRSGMLPRSNAVMADRNESAVIYPWQRPTWQAGGQVSR